MALTADITVPNSAGTNKTFIDLQRVGRRWERLRSDTSLAAPSMFVVDHTTTKTKGGIYVDRHLIQATVTELTSTGEPVVTVANFTISMPRNAPDGVASAKDVICFICNFINASATVTLEPALISVIGGQS